MSVTAKNYAALSAALDQHAATCSFPAVAILLHPIELERNGWEDGEEFRGVELRAEPSLATGTFHVMCEGELGSGEKTTTTTTAPAPGELVPVG